MGSVWPSGGIEILEHCKIDLIMTNKKEDAATAHLICFIDEPCWCEILKSNVIKDLLGIVADFVKIDNGFERFKFKLVWKIQILTVLKNTNFNGFKKFKF